MLLALAIALISIPKEMSLVNFTYNIALMLGSLAITAMLAKVSSIDIKKYLSFVGLVWLATFLLLSFFLILDNGLGLNGTIVGAMATIITYYAIVVLSYQVEQESSLMWGVLSLLWWFIFYFYVLTLTL
ncbi:MAG: hypothetical protein D6769_01475 [Methanobacteriota archaeon]|nr:MAG: hypothetical protein D6769_01475 [Euryarchaeota archaeon]